MVGHTLTRHVIAARYACHLRRLPLVAFRVFLPVALAVKRASTGECASILRARRVVALRKDVRGLFRELRTQPLPFDLRCHGNGGVRVLPNRRLCAGNGPTGRQALLVNSGYPNPHSDKQSAKQRFQHSGHSGQGIKATIQFEQPWPFPHF